MKYLVSYKTGDDIYNTIVDWDCISEDNINYFESHYNRLFGEPYNTIIGITKLDK